MRAAATRQGQKRDLARQLRRDATDVEHIMWYLLRDRRLARVKFRRQVPIGPYVADFACIAHRIVVELDGGQHWRRLPMLRPNTVRPFASEWVNIDA